MDYSGVLSLIGNSPGVAPHLFETFIASLLGHIAQKQGKTVQHVSDHAELRALDRGFDVLAPQGLEGLEGPTAVEIKFKSSVSESFVRKELIRLHDVASSQGCKSAFLVFSGKLIKTPASVGDIEYSFKDAGLHVRIWDYDAISKAVDANRKFVDELVPRLSIAHLESVASSQPSGSIDDWKGRRERHIEELRSQYRNNNLTMFLGAGVSMGAGVPTWNQLLNDLFAELVARQVSFPATSDSKERDEIVARFVDLNAPSPLVAGRYIRKGLANDFIDKISKLLYRNIRPFQAGITDTLGAIARLCIPKRTGPGVRAVVTYNFDDLLEERLKELHVPNHPVFRSSEEHLRDELPVYHVHGFLPRKRDEYPGASDSLLVFSEEGYHSLYRDPYFWSNFIQLTLLKDSSCLMVGLSLTDPNLRRLLEIAAPQDAPPRHYAIMRRLSFEQFVKKDERVVVSAPRQVVEEFLSGHHQAEERLYQELGIFVVWVEKFDEIPDVLTKIRSA